VLEMFERLLAALIILALLVLVMFIALPPGDLQWTRPRAPEPAPSEAAKPEPAKPELVPADNPQPKPVPDEVIVARNEPAPVPPLPDKSPLRTAPVPNPAGSAAETAKGTPTPKEPQDRAVASSDAPPKQKFVKSFLDRLPLSPAAEPAPRSSATARNDQLPLPPEDKPRPNSAKSDKLYTERRPRLLTPPPPPAPRLAARDTRERSDEIGNYIRQTDGAPTSWYRARYYDCPDGRCDCNCPHPYWASSAGCWD